MTRRLVVGRLRRPHGLKGDCAVFPLTNDPATVFAPGRVVWVTDLAGTALAGPLEVSRSKSYHREWLMAFLGVTDRTAIDALRDGLLVADADTLAPPAEGEVYLHELAGFAVVAKSGEALGVVSAVDELPSGVMLEVQGKKREFLLPFRKEFVVEVDRGGRRLIVDLPDGLVE